MHKKRETVCDFISKCDFLEIEFIEAETSDWVGVGNGAVKRMVKEYITSVRQQGYVQGIYSITW